MFLESGVIVFLVILKKEWVIHIFTVQTQVDIAYVPFVERYQAFLLDVKKYDITEGRPKLAAWLEVLGDLLLPYVK